MIPVVKWTKKGFARELPIMPEENLAANGNMEVERDADDYNFEDYDAEDSFANQRPPSVCFRNQSSQR